MVNFHYQNKWLITLLLLIFSWFQGIAADDVPGNWLCFTAELQPSVIGYRNYGDNAPDVQYSLDGGASWSVLEPDELISLKEVGDKIYFRGNNPDGFSHEALDEYSQDLNRKCTIFLMTGKFAASGSVMSLIDGEGSTTTIPCDYCFNSLFHYGTITSAPELPATTLKNYCYQGMFRYCRNLSECPELPATELTEGCYMSMFENCTSLNVAPALRAQTMKAHCYEAMFSNCQNLTQAPELPATELADNCYAQMLRYTSVTEAPELPATELAPYCYRSLFERCAELTTPPALPAKELVEGCYQGMFQGCKNLGAAPELPAEDLVKNCYDRMFSSCVSLNYIKVGVSSLDNDVDATSDWVSDVNTYGVIIFPCGSKYDKRGPSEAPSYFEISGSPIIIFQNQDKTILFRDTINCGDTPHYQGDRPSAGTGTVFKDWDKPLEPIDLPGVYYFTATYENGGDAPADNCMCFTAVEGRAAFSTENFGGNNPSLEYTRNGGVSWIPLGENEVVLLENAGDKVYVRGFNPDGFSKSGNVYTQFKTTGNISVSGSVMSLVDGEGTSTNIPGNYCFAHLFENSTITSAPSLPAVSLREACYDHMFAGCESLTTIPELPAMELAPSCYTYMFAGCNALDSVKSLPAMDLAPYCYANMFQDCKGLVFALYELPALFAEEGCYASMFSGCESLPKAPDMPATNLSAGCYAFMFYGCTGLYNGPDHLPAHEMAENCYESMFANCTHLVDAVKMVALSLADGCCKRMYKGCESIESTMLDGRELKKECYYEMFSGCKNLRHVSVNLYSLDNDVDATLNWVEGVESPGLFIFLCGSTYDKHGVSEVPDNFTIKGSPIIVFLNKDSTELWRDTVNCTDMPVYLGELPTFGEDLVFIGWDKDLEIPYEAKTYYYVAQYGEKGEVAPGPWLSFTAEEAGSSFWYENHGENHPDVQYSMDDGETWTTLQPDIHIVAEKAGQTFYLRGNNPDGFSHGGASNNSNFGMTGRIAAGGNVMSLIDENVAKEIPCAHCFDSLFAGCASLTKAPELLSVWTTDYCYKNMFSHCTGLTEAPELPSYGLSAGCYSGMFSYCENLTKAPVLDATTIKERCYERMFQGCTSLEQAPELVSNLTKEGCYYGMFMGCTNLKEAPVIATSFLTENCFADMFNGCTNLRYVMMEYLMTLDNDVNATKNWVEGVDGEGLFIFPCGSTYDKHGISEVPDKFTIKSSPVVVFQNPDGEVLQSDTLNCHEAPQFRGDMPTYGDGQRFSGWDKPLETLHYPGLYYYTAQYSDSTAEVNDWLCFTAEEAGSEVWPRARGVQPDMWFSVDEGLTWQRWELEQKVTLKNVGDKVYVKGYNPKGLSNFSAVAGFSMSGRIAASGSVMSLIDGSGETTEIPCDYCFAAMFESCDALTHAPKLPATTLKEGCYVSMFGFCSNLTDAPELPAEELAPMCYISMFQKCFSLQVAPKLPATQLANMCYTGMFVECVSLKETPALPATSLAPECYSHMFAYCTELIKSSNLPARELANSCYSDMFAGCSKLIEAPTLPATELEPNCYSGMFAECESLVQAPELPANQLVYNCYRGMFASCQNLNYIKVGVTTLDNNFSATENWVVNVNGPGTFIFPCGSKYDKHGSSEVPDSFKIISSPIVVFQNPDNTELWRDTIDCRKAPEYKGDWPPTYGDDLVFSGWDKELTILPDPDVYYFTAQYRKNEPYSVRDSVVIACDSFLLNGKKLLENTTWTDTVAGDRLVINYQLLLSHSTERDSSIIAEGCFTWKGTTYTTNASWSDTLQTVFGCDSIINYYLEIKDITTISTTFTEKDTAACDVLVFKGITYTEDATWNDTLQTTNGADSIIVYHLTIHQSVVVDTTVTAMESVTWQGVTYTESASWSDTLQTINGCDSIIRVNLVVKTVAPPPITVDKMVSACDSFVYDGITYREDNSWNEMLKTASGGDSIVSYRLTIHKSVTKDSSIIAEGSYTWKGTTYTEDTSWSDTLQTVFGCDSIVNYSLTIEKETPTLQLTVEDELYLVLPGGSETIFYELTGGEGSKYEVRYGGQTISSGDVTNDSTVSLTCPSSLEPGAYTATMEMCDSEGNCAEKEFTFNVMRPDDKQKSFYVKVWNDVVICRNGGGEFLTFQWHKGRKKCEEASLQYFTDVTLLDGEYMVFVTDKNGKSYFIEPITYEPVEAAYAITAEPNVVKKFENFTVKVTGVEPDDLPNARIVVYRADGVVEKIVDEVKEEDVMSLKAGEYVIVLTVNDGKNANCKVLVK